MMGERKFDTIKSVSFGVFSPDEVLRAAAAKVTVSATHASSLPCPGGPNDVRLGTTDRRLKCATCERPCSECVGHMGAIQLAFPVYNVGFFDLVLKLLKVVCFYCSSLLLTPAQVEQLKKLSNRDKKKKLSMAVALCKSKKCCVSCGGQSPIYTKVGLTIRADFSKVSFTDPDEAAYCARPFTSGEARTILQNISNADCTILGLNPSSSRPENFVTSVMCVVPPAIRPSVLISEGSKSRGHDDLTSKLCDIIKCNDTVRTIIEKEAASIPEVGLSIAAQTAINDLTVHCGTFANNDIRGQKPSYQRTGMPSKSIMSRLKGKDGRIRGTLMGKRSDFSARSVISPCADMDIDEVGIPFKVAKTLTLPEKATDLNMSVLRERIRKGSSFDAGGAYSIIREDGTIVLLEFADHEKEANQLKIGDVVERYLRDGDYVLFNRQPSLHKGSFMAFRVKLMSDKAFRINLACTPSLNADCDGDEMNIHVLQDAESQTEARVLMAAPLQIVSPQSNKPCMGLVQDALLGAYLLSSDSVKLTRLQMWDMIAILKYAQQPLPKPEAQNEKGEPCWFGRQALEITFPPNLYYTNKKTDPPVIIENGKFISGRLCKLSLGTTYGSLVHMLWLEYSPDICARFMSDMQRLVNRFLVWNGFSVRFSDCLTNKDVQNKIRNIIQFAEDKVKKIESNAILMTNLAAEAETVSKRISDQVLTNVGKVVHASLDKEKNALYQTVSCGSKGNLINIAQIMGSVGQQSLEGKRIPSIVNDIQRIPSSLDHSVLRPHGFVTASYVKGLRPDEFFYVNISGREGLIDTSVKTATTGYMQRRLMKALETLKIEHDRTVRNSRDDIVQYIYGADDFDACFLMRINLEFISREWKDLQESLTSEEAQEFAPILKNVRMIRGIGQGEMDVQAFAPVRLQTAFIQARKIGGTTSTPDCIFAKVQEFCSNLHNDNVSRRVLLELYLRWELRSSALMKLCISSEGIDKLLQILSKQIDRAKVDAAEMVGAQASHSISHPLTQLVLNTFHYAGVAAKNVTLGVPRIKELIDVAKNIRTPCMKIVPNPALQSPDAIQYLKNSLIYYEVGWAVASTDILYRPDFFSTEGSEDEKYVTSIDAMFTPLPERFNPYVAYIELKQAPLIERNMEPADVADIINSHLTPNCHIVYAESPMSVWFLKIRMLDTAVGFTSFSDKPNDEFVFLKTVTVEMCDKVCRECYLSGIPGITGVDVNTSIIRSIDSDGEIIQKNCKILETDGSNLSAALGREEILGAMTTTNDVMDVHRTLGLEAAVRVLFDELQITIGFDGNFINPRHLSLLVGLMSCKGYFVAINRHGINRIDNGPLAKCTFEETCDILLEAAAYGEVDRVLGVSESVAVGKCARIGTGACDIYSTLKLEETPIEEEEEDDVVFTSIDADMEQQNSRLDSRPIEMPFSDNASVPSLGSMSLLPSSIQHSFLNLTPQTTQGSYVPSSPRQALQESRKRRYCPTSPRTRNQRQCLGKDSPFMDTSSDQIQL